MRMNSPVPSSGKAFAAAETHGHVLKPEVHLIAHSPELGWRSLYAAIFENTLSENIVAANPNPFLVYHLARTAKVTRKIEDSKPERAVLMPGCFSMTPANVRVQGQGSGRPQALVIYLRQANYAEVVNEMYGCDVSQAPLLPRLAVQDSSMEQLARMVAAALRDDTIQDGLYTDTLAQMIAVHLAQRHSAHSPQTRNAGVESMTKSKMRRMAEFIEANLDQDLTLGKMAAELSLNPLYLPKAFRKAFGQTPHRYVLRRRVERARELLSNTEMPIAQIALASGFCSQSHLCHSFSRHFGDSPALFRRRQVSRTSSHIRPS